MHGCSRKSGRPPREVEAYMAPLRAGLGQYWQVNGVWLEWIRAFRGQQARAWAQEVHRRGSHARGK